MLEVRIAKALKALAIPFLYEPAWLHYVKPARKAKYKPDFVLPNGIVIEAKGRFDSEDRQKMILIKQTYPLLDIRFVFSNPLARISKLSKTTYAMWCERYGFPYWAKEVPDPWLKEQLTLRRKHALEDAGLPLPA